MKDECKSMENYRNITVRRETNIQRHTCASVTFPSQIPHAWTYIFHITVLPTKAKLLLACRAVEKMTEQQLDSLRQRVHRT